MFIFDELNLTWISVTVCQQGVDVIVDQSKSGWLQSIEKRKNKFWVKLRNQPNIEQNVFFETIALWRGNEKSPKDQVKIPFYVTI